MKRKIFKLLLASLFISLFNSCESEEQQNNKSQEILSFKGHVITNTDAKSFQRAFFVNQDLVRKGNAKAIANERSDFWFPAEALSSYILYSQKTAKSKGYEISGYRMYLGANNQNGEIGKYKLFIIPTIQSNSTNSLEKSSSLFPEDIEAMQQVDDANFAPFDISGSGNPPHLY